MLTSSAKIYCIYHSDCFLQKLKWPYMNEWRVKRRGCYGVTKVLRTGKAPDHLFAPTSVSISMLVTWSSWQISVSSTNMRTIPYCISWTYPLFLTICYFIKLLNILKVLKMQKIILLLFFTEMHNYNIILILSKKKTLQLLNFEMSQKTSGIPEQI